MVLEDVITDIFVIDKGSIKLLPVRTLSKYDTKFLSFIDTYLPFFTVPNYKHVSIVTHSQLLQLIYTCYKDTYRGYEPAKSIVDVAIISFYNKYKYKPVEISSSGTDNHIIYIKIK